MSSFYLIILCKVWETGIPFLANFMLAQMDSFEFGDQVVQTHVRHTLISSWFHLFEKDNHTFYVRGNWLVFLDSQN